MYGNKSIDYLAPRKSPNIVFTFGAAVRSSRAVMLQHLRGWSTWLSNKSVVEFGSGGVNFFVKKKYLRGWSCVSHMNGSGGVMYLR